jgi:hypothetical protein
MVEATAWIETLAQCAEFPPLDPMFAFVVQMHVFHSETEDKQLKDLLNTYE